MSAPLRAGVVLCLLVPGAAHAQDPAEVCRRASALYDQGRGADAVAAYRECLALVPDNPAVLTNYGAALVAAGAYDEGIAQYARALELAPGQPVIRRNLAIAYYKSGRLTDAASLLDDLRRADPGNASLALLLADCRLQLGDAAGAVEILRPLAPQHGGEPAFGYLYGLALMSAGRVDEAQVVIDPLLRDRTSAEAQILIGAAALARKDFPAAVTALSAAARINPALPLVHGLHGQALLATGDPDGAADAFRRELATNPNDFDANLRLGEIHLERRQFTDALPRLSKAVQVRSSSLEARHALARALAATGAHDQAREQFERIVAEAPAFAPAHAGLAAAYDALGRKADADTHRAAAAAIAPPGSEGELLATGSRAPAFTLRRAGEGGSLGLDALLQRGAPVVLVFGSLSCPKFRFDAASLQGLADRYANRAAFAMVYVHEAHGDDNWQSTINERERVSVRPIRTFEDKQHNGAFCVRTLKLTFPAVVDGLDRAVERAYAAWPSAAYIVGPDGRIAWSSRLGEQEFVLDEMRTALDRALAETQPRPAPAR